MVDEKTLIIQDPVLKRGFTAIPNVVMFAPGLSMAAKCLYAVLLSFAWQDGECFPGQEKLAKACDCTDRTIRKYLDELRAYGLISWVQRGLNRPNIYYIHDLSRVDRLKGLISPDRKELSDPDRKGFSDPDRKELSVLDRKGLSVLDRKGFSVLDRKELSDEEYSDQEYTDQEDSDKNNVVVVNREPARKNMAEGIPVKPAAFSTAGRGTVEELVAAVRDTTGAVLSEGFAAEMLREHGAERVAAALEELKRQVDEGIKIKKVGSWLRRALERGYSPDQPSAVRAGPGCQRGGPGVPPQDSEKQDQKQKKKEFIKSLYV